MRFIVVVINSVFVIFLIESVKVKVALFHCQFSLKLFSKGLSVLMGFKIYHLLF